MLKRITVRGSIVGTRQDLEEAPEFAGSDAVAADFSWDRLENINAIPHHAGAILICEEAPVRGDIKKLCQQIIESQRSELFLSLVPE